MRSVKYILFMSVFILTELNIYSQMDFDLAVSTGKILSMDLGYVSPSDVHFKIYVGMGIGTGEKGEYYNTINWDQFSEDHRSEGSYYNVYGIGFGYLVGNLLIDGKAGYAEQILYRNCFDDTYILGNNGRYHKTAKGDNSKFDAGIDIYYLIDSTLGAFKIGLGLSSVQKLAFSLGYLLEF